MSDLEGRDVQSDKPRVGIPKINLGNAPKPPAPTQGKTQEAIAGKDEEPDLEKYSFFHWDKEKGERSLGGFEEDDTA